MTDALRNSLPVRQIKSGFANDSKSAETNDFLPHPLAQNGASESARESARHAEGRAEPKLGLPLSITEVAQLLGCSAWTVRQRYMPQGLPHLRATHGGRLVFFRDQVITWILKRQQFQQKGGPTK